MRDQPRACGLRPSLIAAAALAACTALASPAESQTREPLRGDALKAEYLLTFLRFVEWPPIVAADTLNACFIGDSGVYDEISGRQSFKRLGVRQLVARRLAAGDSVAACQVLYIDADRLASVSDLIHTRPSALLTVSDEPDFLRHGGIIALFAKNDRLAFRISADNARLANLRISASLLQLHQSLSSRPES